MWTLLEEASSYYLEQARLIDEREILDGAEIFVFTDMTTAELAIYRGTSSSR